MDAQKEVSFAALSLMMEDGSLMIAFRGTDNTLTVFLRAAAAALGLPIPEERE